MRKIKSVILGIVFSIVGIIIMGICVPQVRFVMTEMLNEIFLPIFNKFFLKDWIEKGLLFVVVALVLFGTTSLSKRRENKVWDIVEILVTIFGIAAMWK